MWDTHADLTADVVYGLGWFWLILFAMNAVWTVRSYRTGRCVRLPRILGAVEIPVALVWALWSALLLAVALVHFLTNGDPSQFAIRLPIGFKNGVDQLIGNPVLYFVASLLMFVATIRLRYWLIRPAVGWCLLNGALVFLALSMTDWDFRQIVGKPDNVPIVAMLYLVAYFTWLYFARACENDTRRTEGRPLVEDDKTEVLVWPDLVYIELICMVALTALLIFWGIGLQAPLEEPASAARTPNPSKAPWYFLGLQEMLVYFDPWLAGVIFPALIIVGLMAIPYLDVNPKGNGYYTFRERKFAVITFLFGFLPLWVAMIILGTFLRGPNWNMFGIYELWDVHKLEALNNVNLSEYFYLYAPAWLPWSGALPTAAPGASGLDQLRVILLREAPGIGLLFLYFVALPPLLARTVFRSLSQKMGFLRYTVFVLLLLMMAALPIKMVLHWSLNLKYIVAIPEWFFNV